MYVNKNKEVPLPKSISLTPNSLTVLVVDDDASNIQLLLSMLENDYHVLVATSGDQALKILDQSDNVSLVLLDVDMPLLSGFEVLKRIRTNPFKANLPVIMVTAQNHENHEAYALEQGANDFISKPISAPVVKARIKTQLCLYQSTQTITQKNKELKHSFQNLQKAKEELSHFMALVSHELRTPIAILQCETELLNDGIRKPSPENLASLLEEIKHVSALINDMFDLVLSESKALSFVKEPTDVKSLLDRSIVLFKKQFEDNQLTLSSSVNQEENFWVFADTKRIRQVIDNLLRNSLKYTDKGGKVHITLDKLDTMLCIRIEDSEPGVVHKNISKLFDRFYRVEESRNRAMGGSGLGLSICKTIIEAHAGSISAEPSLQGGLMIKTLLPWILSPSNTHQVIAPESTAVNNNNGKV